MQLRQQDPLPHLALPRGPAALLPGMSGWEQMCSGTAMEAGDPQQAGGENEAVHLMTVTCLPRLKKMIHFKPQELKDGLAQQRMGENSQHSLD